LFGERWFKENKKDAGTVRSACSSDLTYRVRRVVQSHVDVIVVNLVVCIFLFVASIFGFLNLWERVFDWIGENLVLDFVEVGKIVEHCHSVKVVVRLEQIRTPSSLRDVRNAMKSATKAKV
jgi:hypothetical protein